MSEELRYITVYYTEPDEKLEKGALDKILPWRIIRYITFGVAHLEAITEVSNPAIERNQNILASRRQGAKVPKVAFHLLPQLVVFFLLTVHPPDRWSTPILHCRHRSRPLGIEWTRGRHPRSDEPFLLFQSMSSSFRNLSKP